MSELQQVSRRRADMQGASAAEPDDEGQQYLDRQRHAAAVQLHSRQLAIAFLRAQVKMPRCVSQHTGLSVSCSRIGSVCTDVEQV